MKEGDFVRPRGNTKSFKKGKVRSVSGHDVEVVWIMGSGWKHIVMHDINELEEV